jgi:acyl-CoA reductase-like NAD-dependent aldehyde dehydrogenase
MAGLNRENLRVPKTIKLFIGGEFPRTESGRTLTVLRYDSDEPYAHLSLASRKDFRNAVDVAREAQKSWEERTAYNRAQILYRMAEMMESKREEFCEIMGQTLGFSPEKANLAVDGAVDGLVYHAGWADKFQQIASSINPVSGPHHNFTMAEPVGVVGFIADENFDLARLISDLAAVLASGNALVVLLAHEGSALIAPLAEAIATSDMPKGVVNLLTGDSSELASHFGSHMEMQALAYGGSDPKLLSELRKAGVDNMKRILGRTETTASLERILDFVEYKTVWHPVAY